MLGFRAMIVRFLIFAVPWAAIAFIFYLWLARPLYRMGRMTKGAAIFCSLIWPISLLLIDSYMLTPPGTWRDTEFPWRSGSGDASSDPPPKADYNDAVFGGEAKQDAPKQTSAPRRKPSYNNIVFGGEETEEEASEREILDFIAAQTGIRYSAPLKEEFTISYGPSGISKTYPAGTVFPDAFIADWKAGFFKRS